MYQEEIEQHFLHHAHDRHINFIYDPRGNTGKSWFQNYILTKYNDITAKINWDKNTKNADIAHIVKTKKNTL